MRNRIQFAQLVGEVFTSVEGLKKGGDVVTFKTESGRTFQMYHDQDCCEHVQLEDVAGDVNDLIGSRIVSGEESSNHNGSPQPGEYSESWTWTFYRLATSKGDVVMRWLGESNGYYSESVDIFEVVN